MEQGQSALFSLLGHKGDLMLLHFRPSFDELNQAELCVAQLQLGEFLEPLKLSQYRVAKSIGVPPRRVNEIVHGKRAITADTALRLARYFGTSPEFWLNLQSLYDLRLAERKVRAKIMREITPLKVA